ncbi:hypothetical protein GCM10027168_73750 [Streptomyces capparidis]
MARTRHPSTSGAAARRSGGPQPGRGRHPGRHPGRGPGRGPGGRGRDAHAARRRDVPCTVAVLVGHEDFAAMRHYTSFPFTDYGGYLRHVEEQLRALRSRGLHVLVAVFDPAEYATWCERRGLDPDAAVTRARYAADVAGPGAAVPYTGQPLADLVHAVVRQAERRATRALATRALRREEETGSAVHARLTRELAALLERAGPGEHHLVGSANVHGAPLLAVVDAGGPTAGEDAALFCAVLAAGHATGGGGGAVLRTRGGPGGRDTVRGWALRDGRLHPLTAAEVFDAYCTDHRTGEPIAPEPDVDYEAGFTLDDPPDPPGPPAAREGG